MTDPSDQDEQEADAVANEIVSGGKIAREISGGSGSSGIAVPRQMESRLAQSQGGGHPMPQGLRSMMEGAFGRDLSQVRVHTDSEAAAMSSSIHANAFTYEKDIYFNRGKFAPDAASGQHLIAHELTHVVQQVGKVSRDFDQETERIYQNYDTWRTARANTVQTTNSFSPEYMSVIYNAMIRATKMLSDAILVISDDNPNNYDIYEKITLNDSAFYRDQLTTEQGQKVDRTKRILRGNTDNKERIIANLRSIASSISSFDFNRFVYEPVIVNHYNQNTYGKNKNGLISFSKLFFHNSNDAEMVFSDEDRAFAVIHEFAHFTLSKSNGVDEAQRPKELYMDEIFNVAEAGDRYLDEDIIERSPDFYVFLCAWCSCD